MSKNLKKETLILYKKFIIFQNLSSLFEPYKSHHHTQAHVMLCDILCASKVSVEILHKKNRAISDFRSEGCCPLEIPPPWVYISAVPKKGCSDMAQKQARPYISQFTRRWHTVPSFSARRIQGVSWEPKKTSEVKKIVKS